MKWLICIFCVGLACTAFGQPAFQLAPPRLHYPSVFFDRATRVTMEFGLKGTIIRYTTDGSIPDEHSAVYTSPVSIERNMTVLAARVFGDGFLASDVVKVTFVQGGIAIREVLTPLPHENYPGEGDHTLFDNKGGFPDYHAKSWMGFPQDTVHMTIIPGKKSTVHAVLLDLLQDPGAWIFFPASAIIRYRDRETGLWRECGTMNWTPDQQAQQAMAQPFLVRLASPVRTKEIEVELHLLRQIPAWHPGHDQKSWIFIDEVKLF